MNNAKKSAEKKTVSPAENKPAAEVKTEVKPAAPAAKSAVKKAASSKADKPTAAKTKTASKTAAKTASKPAAKKAAAKTVAKPTAKKTAAKPAAKTDGAAAKKGGRKPKAVTILTICEKLEKKISKTKAAAVKGKVAADIEVWGFEDGSNAMMYVEIIDGKVTVSPHNYEARDFRVSLSFANAVAFADGKLSLTDLVASNDFYAEGNIAAAVKMAAIF